MPLSADPVSRIHKHPCNVRVEAHAHADGLRDVETYLTGVKRVRRPRLQRDAYAGTD